MKKFTVLEAVAHLALAGMSALWIGFAWHVLLSGGTYHTAIRTRDTVFIGGAGGVLIAYILLSLGAISLAILFKRLGVARYASVAAAVAILGLPTAYLLLR